MLFPKLIAIQTRGVAKLIKAELTRYISKLPEGKRVIVLGAGQCNDIPLDLLKKRYKEVILIEIDNYNLKFLKDNLEKENVKVVKQDISPVNSSSLKEIEEAAMGICQDCGLMTQSNQVGGVIKEYLVDKKEKLGSSEEIYPEQADLVIASMVLHHVAKNSALNVMDSIRSQIFGMNSFVDHYEQSSIHNIFKKMVENAGGLVGKKGRCLMVFPSFQDFDKEIYKYVPRLLEEEFKIHDTKYNGKLDFYLLSK